MCDVDAEFDALLNDDGMAEVNAMLAEGNSDASAADTTVKVDTKPALASQELKQKPATAFNKPALSGKKRQLLVPQQASSKRVFVQMKNPSPDSGGSALSPKQPSSSPAAPAAAPEPAPAPKPSAASSPTKTKPASADFEPSAASSPSKIGPAHAAADTKATDAKGADDMEIDADEEQHHNGTDIAEAVPAAGEEPEVQSPLKKPRPETDEADEPAAEPDKPSTAAASAGAPSTKAATGPETDATPSSASKAAAAAGKPKPKPKPKTVAPKAATNSSASAAAGTGFEAAGQKMPKAQTAFFFFCTDARSVLKEKEPGLSMPECSKKLGEMWRELSEAEKKPYQEMATAEKERVAEVIAAMDPSVKAAIEKAAADARAAKKQKKTGKVAKAEGVKETKESATESKESAKAAAKEAKKSEKAAAKAEEVAKKQAIRAAKAEADRKDRAGFKVFHCKHFATFKADNPGMEPAELSGMMAKAWEALEEAQRDDYMKKAEEEAEAAAAQKAMKAKSAKSAKSAGNRSKKMAGSDAENEDDSEQETEAAGIGGSSRRRAAAAEEEDEDSDREDVDWEEYPAAGVFSRGDGAFLVARHGVMLTEYGKVDTRKAKARLLHGGAGSSSEAELPVTTQAVEEYELSTKKFWTAVKSRMIQGALDLEELEDGSPLEMCYLLGKLQEKGYELDPLAKRPKGDLDVVRRLPVMRLSMVVQRLLDMERRNSKAAAEELTRVKDVLSGMIQAVKNKGDDGLRKDDAAVVAAAALLEGS